MNYYQEKFGKDPDPFEEDMEPSNGLYNIDQITFQQIENLIQQQYGVIVPAIVFEYLPMPLGKDITGFDYEDLYNFFVSFGEVDALELNGKLSLILFKTFFDANTAREFLQNEANFKENVKSNFRVRWYKFEDDIQILDEEIKAKILKYTQNAFEMNGSGAMLTGPMGSLQGQFPMGNMNHLNMNPMLGQNISYSPQGQGMNMNVNMGMNKYPYQYFIGGCGFNGMPMNGMTNMNGINCNIMRNGMNSTLQTMNQMGSININSINGADNSISNTNNNAQNVTRSTNISSSKSSSSNGLISGNNSAGSKKSMGESEEKKGSTSLSSSIGKGILSGSATSTQNGKYTCRFEIQIENDKEFQVARRLIGAKGCNMKKIVEMCSKNSDGTTIQDSVKLRLRGKGSGYKEGPLNKESDEPLHLCISSKFLDKYKIACQLVNELIASVFEEYKRYCERTNKIPVNCLAIRKEEGISSRKGTLSKLEPDI